MVLVLRAPIRRRFASACRELLRERPAGIMLTLSPESSTRWVMRSFDALLLLGSINCLQHDVGSLQMERAPQSCLNR